MKNSTTYWIEINIDGLYIYGITKTPILKGQQLEEGQQLEVQMINGEAKIIIDGIPHKNLFLFRDKTYTISSLIGMEYISDITKQVERNEKIKKILNSDSD